jgi:hypothetical protein
MPWYTDAGTMTGIIGAVTGTAGFVLGLTGYRRANAIKALDLRIELKKAVVAARLELYELPKFIDCVHGSHIEVAAATGILQSGGNEVWKNNCKTDRAEAKTLAAELPVEAHDYLGMSESELEAALVKVHELRLRANRLRQKYERQLSLDDKQREELRARHNPPRP